MTDKPTRSTKPANNDVIIREWHDKSDTVRRWLLSGGPGFAPKYCRTKKEVVLPNYQCTLLGLPAVPAQPQGGLMAFSKAPFEPDAISTVCSR